MSPQRSEFPQHSSPKPIDESLLDTVLEPEFTTTTLFSVPVGFDYSHSHDQSNYRIEPQQNSGPSASSSRGPGGSNESQRANVYRRQNYLPERESDSTQSASPFSTTSSLDSMRTRIPQRKNHSPEPQEEHIKSSTPPITPPGIDEYIQKMKFHQKDILRRPLLPSTTTLSTPSEFAEPQYPQIIEQSKYVPNFSRPFSSSNPPAVLDAAWRARLLQQKVQEDEEPEPVERYLRGKLAEELLTKEIDGLRKEVDMVDSRSDELKKAVEILDEAEGLIGKDDDDYDTYDYAKID